MNRQEKRQYIRKIKGRKGLKKKHSKGCFGKLPQYLTDDKKIKENCQKVTVSNKKEVE